MTGRLMPVLLCVGQVKQRSEELKAEIRTSVEDTTTVILLEKMVDVIDATYRTNLFMPNRFRSATTPAQPLFACRTCHRPRSAISHSSALRPIPTSHLTALNATPTPLPLLPASQLTLLPPSWPRRACSLAFRVDPRIMLAAGENRVLPFGVFFVHGRRFNGFHVRFRDIARGGLRIVSPPTPEQIAIGERGPP